MDTLSMEVPGWASGDEVNDEMWVGFGGRTWIETGQFAGRYRNCCTLYPFYAAVISGKFNYEYFSPNPGPAKTYSDHYEIQDPSHTGYWGIWWNGTGNQTGNLMWASKAGEYPAYAKNLEGGMEAAANSQPYNWARDEVAAVVPPGDGWTEWKSAFGVHSEVYKSPHQCVYRNPEDKHYGSIEFSTCIFEE